MPKITALPSMTSPDPADPAPVVDDSAIVTKKLTLGGLRDWLYSLVNVPAGPASPVTRDSEHFFDHVASGLVLTGDSYGSNRNASMTSGVCYINGRRISLTAVSARNYTASRDTYVDVLDNGDGTGTVVYTEVTNNNASPALAANSIRIGIIVTAAGSIAAVGSVNQGQFTKVLPIASSVAYSVVDSLGNLICSRDPSRRVLGYRAITSTFSSSGTSLTKITGLDTPFIAPTGRKIRATLHGPTIYANSGNGLLNGTIWDGAPGGTKVGTTAPNQGGTSSLAFPLILQRVIDNISGSKTYTAALQLVSGSAAMAGADASSDDPLYLLIELL